MAGNQVLELGGFREFGEWGLPGSVTWRDNGHGQASVLLLPDFSVLSLVPRHLYARSPPKISGKISRSRDRSWEVWGEGLEGWLFIIGLYHLVTDPKLEIGARGAGSECVSWDGEGQPPGSGSAGCSRQHVMP